MTKHQSKIEQLIVKLCPNGVEFKSLGELGVLYGGLSGKSKEDFSDGNSKFVTYMNIASNIAINTDINTFVKIGVNENQNKIEYGDVLFTGSSETPDEVGMSSVLTSKIDEPLYLNSFCFGFRLFDKNLFLPEFLKYVFRDEQARKQIIKTASGVTRFNVSKKRFAKVKIPIPPLAVQEEIATILNSFTELESELEAELESELEARKKQYEYYRAQLLTFPEGVRWIPISEIMMRTKGTKITAEQMKRMNKIDAPIRIFAGGKTFASVDYGDIPDKDIQKKISIIVKSRGNIEFEYYEKPFSHKAEFWAYHSKNNDVNIKFAWYYLKNNEYFFQDLGNRMSKMPQISSKDTDKYKIPVPSIAEQERIVSILDKFDALKNDISIGLPAELKARRSQYEYYRGKLLTFNEHVH